MSTSCSSTDGFEPSSGAQLKEPPTSTSSTSLEIGQSDVVPQYLHPERLPRATDRDSRYLPLEKGGSKGRDGHNRGKRQAEDIEKSNMDFLRKFSEASLKIIYKMIMYAKIFIIGISVDSRLMCQVLFWFFSS